MDSLILDGLDLSARGERVEITNFQGDVTWTGAWTIREGDTITFPADPAVCPDCNQLLVAHSRVSKPYPSRDHSVYLTLHETSLRCTNDGCATDVVNLSTTAEDRS